jgi:hypothetical protein
VTEHRLFRNLGRLSKVISNCIEAARTPAELHAVQEALASLQSLSRTVSSSFRHSGWEDAAGTSKAMGKNALPWSILKAYLFSMTLIHFSVIALINAVESASSPPSSTSTQMCMTAVTTFRQLHFITLKFGHQGFPTYQGLFLGLTDVLKRSDPATVQAFLEREREDMSGRPDESAYWLVMCEEVMPLLHGDLVEQLLEEAKRHLEEGSQKDLVEGSHAVLLSVMEHQPNVARGLIPWYHAWQLEVRQHPSPELCRTARTEPAPAQPCTAGPDVLVDHPTSLQARSGVGVGLPGASSRAHPTRRRQQPPPALPTSASWTALHRRPVHLRGSSVRSRLAALLPRRGRLAFARADDVEGAGRHHRRGQAAEGGKALAADGVAGGVGALSGEVACASGLASKMVDDRVKCNSTVLTSPGNVLPPAEAFLPHRTCRCNVPAMSFSWTTGLSSARTIEWTGVVG